MDEVHCVIAVVGSEVAKFEMPQTNAVTTSFLYVLSSPPAGSRRSRVGLRRCGNDNAKLQTFSDMAKKSADPVKKGLHGC